MRRLGKAALVLCLGLVLYLIAANSGAGWLYVLTAMLGSVLLVSVPAPLYNVQGLILERRVPVVGTPVSWSRRPAPFLLRWSGLPERSRAA